MLLIKEEEAVSIAEKNKEQQELYAELQKELANKEDEAKEILATQLALQ